MRCSALAFAICLAASASLAAADDVSLDRERAFDWSGFYAGVHAGRGFATAGFRNGLASASTTGEDFVLGLHAGYARQLGPLVLGVEVDGFNDIRANGSPTGGASARIEWQTSARGTVGLAYDRVLVYATGGVVLAGAEVAVATVTASGRHVGWTAGGGFGLAFTDRIVVRGEYLHRNFGETRYDLAPLPDNEVDFDNDVFRAAVDYRF